jgi:hypothetical protein
MALVVEYLLSECKTKRKKDLVDTLLFKCEHSTRSLLLTGVGKNQLSGWNTEFSHNYCSSKIEINIYVSS